jgi:hypothetical protein
MRYESPAWSVAGEGHAEVAFNVLCRDPLRVSLASDSPPLSQVRLVDFSDRLGVLVTDPVENLFFWFDTTGTLRGVLGGSKVVFGEFEALTDAVFVDDSILLVLDRVRGLSVFRTSGGVPVLVRTATVTYGEVLAGIAGRRVLIGTSGPSGTPRVGVLDLDAREVVASFALRQSAPSGHSDLGGPIVAAPPRASRALGRPRSPSRAWPWPSLR